MALNITGSVRFSNDNSMLYYPPNGTNRNNGYFSNEMTITSTPSYPTVTATSGATVTESAILVSDSAGGNFVFDDGQSTIKFSGNYTLDTGTSNIIFKPYRILDSTTDVVTSASAEIETTPHTMTTGDSGDGQLRICSGDTSEYTVKSDDFPITYYGGVVDIKEAQKLIKRQYLKRNLVINIKSRANLIRDIPKNEQVAIETLREEITETEFRKYIKYGFVLVEGQSGKTYQVFRNESHTKVWKGGKVIEEVCVRIRDYKIPPTDNVIAFLNMIQIDENEFRKMGNVYKIQRAA